MPRSIGGTDRRSSSRLGYSSRKRTRATGVAAAGAAIVASTSATPNRPAVTAMKLSPAWAPPTSNVKRTVPPSGSMPTVDSMTPEHDHGQRLRAASRRSGWPAATRPSRAKAKYSAGPKASAARATSGAASCSATTLKVPATNDAMAAMASAAPARPLRASR